MLVELLGRLLDHLVWQLTALRFNNNRPARLNRVYLRVVSADKALRDALLVLGDRVLLVNQPLRW